MAGTILFYVVPFCFAMKVTTTRGESCKKYEWPGFLWVKTAFVWFLMGAHGWKVVCLANDPSGLFATRCVGGTLLSVRKVSSVARLGGCLFAALGNQLVPEFRPGRRAKASPLSLSIERDNLTAAN